MINASLKETAQLLAVAAPTQDVHFQGISIDTRTLQAGNLFIAILGEQLDGHQFVTEAYQKGAVAALVSQPVDCPIPQLIVEDTTRALGTLAGNWRDRFSLPLVAITGSNGKTTLKNMLASILRVACYRRDDQVLATEGNLNNHIGLPLNLARLGKQHQFAVLEMGMNHFGEIDYLTHLAKPTVAVITNAAEAHLEGVQDVAGVAKAKGEIFLGLAEKGIAVLNRDDAHFSYWRDLLGTRNYIGFGLKSPADVSVVIGEDQNLLIKTPRGKVNVKLSLLGKHNVVNALAATAAALVLGIPLNTIKIGLEQVRPAPGRMRQYTAPSGANIIDDTYNANPFSLQAAINTLADIAGKKILVLGDMKELGPDAEQFHRDAAEKIHAAGIGHLFTLGKLSQATTSAFGANATHFTQHESLINALKPYLDKDVTVLVKGSRSMQMEKIISGIIPAEQLEHAH